MIRCSVCKGTNVEIAQWVQANTHEVRGDFGSWSELDTKWCNTCEEHTALVDDDALFSRM